MKTLLVGINSKYIHTCLAIWYLKASALKYAQKNDNGNANESIAAREFSINDNKDSILSEIYKEKPDILAFSCYIWNIDMVLLISKEIKKLMPHCTVILGGPEVSYDSGEILNQNDSIDFVLSGEGEEAFIILYDSLLKNNKKYQELKGIAYRNEDEVIYNHGFNLVSNLDDIPSPYSGDLLAFVENRIVYYESSRGCPFSCSYCISSTFNGVRYFSLDRVKNDLDRLLLFRPKLIKFVDRTFNCNRQRAKDILKHIISLDSDTVFHFEVAGDIFDDELLDLLKSAKDGLIQLEIGLQTTNAKTLKEIDRVTDIDVLEKNVKAITNNKNIHIHLDLIAGLPFEDFASFRESFNDVYAIKPHQLQLGFLKLLKGAKIRNQAEKHGYKFRNYAPYEVLSNSYIKYEEILFLKDVEEVLERYFNSSRFSMTLDFMEKTLKLTAFELYCKLSDYCRKNGYLDRPISYKENIYVLHSFYQSIENNIGYLETFRQSMIFDFLSSDSSCSIPDYLKHEEDLIPNNVLHQLLKNEDFIKKYLPQFEGKQVKNIIKKVFIIKKSTNIDQLVMFDYTQKNPVTEKYRYIAFPYSYIIYNS